MGRNIHQESARWAATNAAATTLANAGMSSNAWLYLGASAISFLPAILGTSKKKKSGTTTAAQTRASQSFHQPVPPVSQQERNDYSRAAWESKMQQIVEIETMRMDSWNREIGRSVVERPQKVESNVPITRLALVEHALREGVDISDKEYDALAVGTGRAYKRAELRKAYKKY